MVSGDVSRDLECLGLATGLEAGLARGLGWGDSSSIVCGICSSFETLRPEPREAADGRRGAPLSSSSSQVSSCSTGWALDVESMDCERGMPCLSKQWYGKIQIISRASKQSQQQNEPDYGGFMLPC